MRVRVFGGVAVEGVPDRDLGSRKARTLLKLLAVRRGRTVPLDVIVDVLWGDDVPARPADQVGVLVSRLRRVLGADRIVRRESGYALVADWIDVAEVAALTEAATRALGEQRAGAALAMAHAALALVTGPLLGDEDGPWVEAERAAVAAVVTTARRIAVEAAAAAGDVVGSVGLAEQVLAEDPYDEVVLRSLMHAHLAAGRPASALAAYARVRARLGEDLGVSPTAETEAVHRLALAAAGDDGGDTPGPRTAVTGLAGRDRELRVLDAALDEVADGATRVVLVEGEAGLGKTALVEAWTSTVDERAAVLLARCDELGRDLPLAPLGDALAARLRGLDRGAVEVVLGTDAPALAPLLGPLAPAPATIVADVEAGRLRLYGALAAAVTRLGGDRPVVVVLDDAHLASPGTLGWLSFVRPRCDRLLVVVTARPGELRLPVDTRLMLEPLALDAVAAVVGDADAVDVLERTGGHPLLVAAFAQAASGRPLDDAVGDAVAAQLDALDADARATVLAAAALGEACDIDLIAQVTGQTALTALAHLEQAVTTGLVVERGRGFAFRHDLVRTAVDATMGQGRRTLVHREAARALAARTSPDLAAVAVHARAGGDDELAARAFVAAAERAAARFDVETAEAHLAEALQLAPSADAYVARARIRMGAMALEAAANDASRAISLGGGQAALEVAGWIAYYRRRYTDAEAFAQEAIGRSGHDPALRVSALALAGRLRHGEGDVAGAVECLATDDEAPPAVRGVADVWLAQARLHQGRPQDALAALRRPLVDPDALAHPWAPLHLRFNHVLALGQLGRVDEALRAAADLDRAVLRAGAVGARFTAPAANVTAWVLRWTGRGGEADELNRRAVVSTGSDGGPSADGFAEGYYVALLDLADGRLLAGDLDGAAALAERLGAVDSWDGTMAWHQRHRLGLLRARLSLAAGNADAAAEMARSVADDARWRGTGRYELLARAVVALADPSVPAAQVEPVIEGLAQCAGLEGWVYVAALARSRDVDAWSAEAARRAALVVSAAGEHRDAAARFADAVLTR